MTDLLRNLFVGDTTINGSMGPLRLEIVPVQDPHQMRVTPRSHTDRKDMSHLVPIYTTLGSSEEEILLLFQLQTEHDLSDSCQIHSTTISPHGNPCTLRQLWDTVTRRQLWGELLLSDPLDPVPEATGNTLSALIDIAGPTLLRTTDGILTTMTPPKYQMKYQRK